MKTSKIVGSVCWYLGFTALAVALGIGNSMANDYHSIISLTLKQDESKIVKNDEIRRIPNTSRVLMHQTKNEKKKVDSSAKKRKRKVSSF